MWRLTTTDDSRASTTNDDDATVTAAPATDAVRCYATATVADAVPKRWLKHARLTKCWTISTEWKPDVPTDRSTNVCSSFNVNVKQQLNVIQVNVRAIH